LLDKVDSLESLIVAFTEKLE